MKKFQIEMSDRTLQKLKGFYGLEIDTDVIEQALICKINDDGFFDEEIELGEISVKQLEEKTE